MGMIRETKESDLEKVFNLIYSAFGNKAESDLVRQLILDEDVFLNLIFESSDTIVGNIVVSKISMAPDKGLLCGGIAPLSVLPENQSFGIGSQLMESAIKKSKEMKIDALFLLGDPNYYKRFNFKVSNLPSDYSAEHFQELELTKDCLVNVKSKVIYANAFTSL
jgi:predicted N-acetyltransferase YhbS